MHSLEFIVPLILEKFAVTRTEKAPQIITPPHLLACEKNNVGLNFCLPNSRRCLQVHSDEICIRLKRQQNARKMSSFSPLRALRRTARINFGDIFWGRPRLSCRCELGFLSKTLRTAWRDHPIRLAISVTLFLSAAS